MIFPIKKELNILGIKVEIIQLKENGEIGAKVFTTQDENGDKLGLKIYKYLAREGFLSKEFLLR